MHLQALPSLELDLYSELTSICGFRTNALGRLVKTLAGKTLVFVHWTYDPGIIEAGRHWIVEPTLEGPDTSGLENFTKLDGPIGQSWAFR